MEKLATPEFISKLKQNIENTSNFIQVVLGPRQVGKTTGVLQYLKSYKDDSLYVSADDLISPSNDWIVEQWQNAISKSEKCLLVIDEIQKVPQWSSAIKRLWEQQKRKQESQIKLILLGSSSLQIQTGLSESLSGRFQLIQAYHWGLKESRAIKKLSVEDFIIYGGYPGSYSLLDDKNEWEKYIKHSIVETVIGKDILSLARVAKPSLFRQTFNLLMSYPAQEMSYTKLLGQLQDSGNTDLVKHYIELYQGAFLIKSIHKYSPKTLVTRTSSPKLIPLCGALISREVFKDKNGYGRALEAMVGATLIKNGFEVFYWRDGNLEVDYVVEDKHEVYAIEVKSGVIKSSKGLNEFHKRFKRVKPIFITESNAESFLLSPHEFIKKL